MKKRYIIYSISCRSEDCSIWWCPKKQIWVELDYNPVYNKRSWANAMNVKSAVRNAISAKQKFPKAEFVITRITYKKGERFLDSWVV